MIPSAAMGRPRSQVHQIVDVLARALARLGTLPAPLDLERWGFAVHGALSAPGREFHNHDHVLELASDGDGDPLDVLAALYHDAVYIQVDQGPPPSMRAELTRVLDRTDEGWRVLSPPTAATADVLAVFGRGAGDVVTPATGLNELASALVAALHFDGVLDREQRLAVATSIEQTIPFRDDPAPALRARLAALEIAADVADALVRCAVGFGNRDVDNFALSDPGRFLDNTWKLLPESNPSLHVPGAYTVRDYRSALEKMEGFLAALPAERVFHRWADTPPAVVHASRVSQVAHNLELAVRYLRAKLYAIAIVEAICAVTGGDVPLDYFMGGRPAPGCEAIRVEHFLPALEPVAGLESVLHALLTLGRAAESSFDTGPSPLAAFLHASCGEDAIGRGVEHARQLWRQALTAEDFLVEQPRRPVAAIVRAAAELMDTRRAPLLALAARLDPA